MLATDSSFEGTVWSKYNWLEGWSSQQASLCNHCASIKPKGRIDGSSYLLFQPLGVTVCGWKKTREGRAGCLQGQSGRFKTAPAPRAPFLKDLPGPHLGDNNLAPLCTTLFIFGPSGSYEKWSKHLHRQFTEEICIDNWYITVTKEMQIRNN